MNGKKMKCDMLLRGYLFKKKSRQTTPHTEKKEEENMNGKKMKCDILLRGYLFKKKISSTNHTTHTTLTFLRPLPTNSNL